MGSVLNIFYLAVLSVFSVVYGFVRNYLFYFLAAVFAGLLSAGRVLLYPVQNRDTANFDFCYFFLPYYTIP